MTASATTAPPRIIYRNRVMFCVLPADLAGHLDELKRFYGDADGVEFLVDRRVAGERRAADSAAPDGVERRDSDRRDGGAQTTAAAIQLALPRSLRKHADRITCTWRGIPVHLDDARSEADALLAAADSDGAARNELRLRYHSRVYGMVAPQMFTRRRALEVTDRVFDELFANHESSRFGHELSRATARAMYARRRPA